MKPQIELFYEHANSVQWTFVIITSLWVRFVVFNQISVAKATGPIDLH